MTTQTKARAIMELACTVAGRDVSGGYGKRTSDALDALADALAGRDVRARPTIAEAVAALGEQVADMAAALSQLRAALESAGVDAGGSVAEAVSAAASALGAGGGDGMETATDDEVRQALKRN